VRNTTQLFIGRKNRTGGGSGPAGRLYFDKETYMLTPDTGPTEPIMNNSSAVVGF
jgi:hypothetical protein